MTRGWPFGVDATNAGVGAVHVWGQSATIEIVVRAGATLESRLGRALLWKPSVWVITLLDGTS